MDISIDDIDGSQFSSHYGGAAQWAGRAGASQFWASLCLEMGNDGFEAEDVTAWSDLRAERGVERDRTNDRCGGQVFYFDDIVPVKHEIWICFVLLDIEYLV